MPGPAVRELKRISQVYAPLVSGLISVIAALLALTVVPADRRVEAVVAVGLLTVWRVVYIVRLVYFAGWPSPQAQGLFAMDIAVTAACALAQRWIDVPHLVADSAGWVQTLVVVTAVSCLWHVGWRAGMAGATILAVSFGAGAVITVGPQLSAVILPAVWVFGNSGMSALTAEFINRGVRRADDATARRERARTDLEVDRVRRDAEREHLAALHDTAAATLLMVGLGTVRNDDRWLPEQAQRDLAVLAGQAPASTTEDLVRVVQEVIATSGIDVHFDAPATDLPLPGDVIAAFAGASREALANVRRHSGTRAALIRLTTAGTAAGPGARLVVQDAGLGLPVAPDGSVIGMGNESARGIRHSIVSRMERVRGQATVAPGQSAGVVVTLEWVRE